MYIFYIYIQTEYAIRTYIYARKYINVYINRQHTHVPNKYAVHTNKASIRSTIYLLLLKDWDEVF